MEKLILERSNRQCQAAVKPQSRVRKGKGGCSTASFPLLGNRRAVARPRVSYDGQRINIRILVNHTVEQEVYGLRQIVSNHARCGILCQVDRVLYLCNQRRDDQ